MKASWFIDQISASYHPVTFLFFFNEANCRRGCYKREQEILQKVEMRKDERKGERTRFTFTCWISTLAPSQGRDDFSASHLYKQSAAVRLISSIVRERDEL